MCEKWVTASHWRLSPIDCYCIVKHNTQIVNQFAITKANQTFRDNRETSICVTIVNEWHPTKGQLFFTHTHTTLTPFIRNNSYHAIPVSNKKSKLFIAIQNLLWNCLSVWCAQWSGAHDPDNRGLRDSWTGLRQNVHGECQVHNEKLFTFEHSHICKYSWYSIYS